MPYLSVSKNENQVTTIMICGRTELLSRECFEMASHSYQIVVVGKNLQGTVKKKQISFYDTQPGEDKFEELFNAYSIDVVWYISGYSDSCRGIPDENNLFAEVSRVSMLNGVQKLIVVTSVEALNFQPVYGYADQLVKKEFAAKTSYLAERFEDLVFFLTRDSDMTTLILRVPYIAETSQFNGYLGDIFRSMRGNGKVIFRYRPENQVDFLSALDLTELLMLVSEESSDKTGAFNVSSGFFLTYGSLEQKLKKLMPELEIGYDEELNYIGTQHFNIRLKRQYGFIPVDNIGAHLEELYQDFLTREEQRKPVSDFLKKVRIFLSGPFMMLIELIVFGLLMELLVRITGDSVYFKFVDIRLFFVLLMGSVHGMAGGLLAGLAAGASLAASYSLTGINATMLFYNVDYWLPFVIYLMTGLITGYMRSTADQKLSFSQNENKLLTDKYLFLMKVYEGLVDNKRQYRKQILSYQDSFGKIYESVQELDALSTDTIFMNGVRVLEKILNNHSVAIYTIERKGIFGRLAVSSVDLRGKLNHSIRLENWAEMISHTKDGQVWRNTTFAEELPAYACGVADESGLRILIMLYKAAPEQQVLYYANLFQIVCNLIRISFLRALDYQEVIEEKKYFPETRILYPVFYENILQTQKEMSDQGVSDFIELKLESKDKQELSEKLETCTRDTDYCGCDEDGNIYLLLTQTDEETFEKYVSRRLSSQFAFTKINH